MDSVSVFWQERKRALMIPAAEETCWNLMTPAGVTTDLVEAKMARIAAGGGAAKSSVISFLASGSPKQYETGGGSALICH